MSLDRFIFCPCTHALEAHAQQGCTRCGCAAPQRDVLDRLLSIERDAIRRTWLGCSSRESAVDDALGTNSP